MSQLPTDTAAADCAEVGGLRSTSFLGLLSTQFLGAVNDNMFRWLVVPIGKAMVSEEHAALALSAGLAAFVLPFIVLAAPAGYLADRFSKRSVILWCKVADIVLMLLGIACIYIGKVFVLYAVVALVGAQAAMFGPAKFGSIPEIVHTRCISAANAVIGLSTVVAVVVGTVAGNYLFALTGPDGRERLWISALALVGVAVLGLLCSLTIAHLKPADVGRKFPRNFVRQTYGDLKLLAVSRPLLRVAFGSAFFWAMASLANLNIDLFAISELNLEQKGVGPLLGVLALGVGLGNVLAGIWSAGKVELGIVPLGALGMAVSSMLLSTVSAPIAEHAYVWSCIWLLTLGTSAGLFDVPLASFMQHRSPDRTRGSILAAGNFLTFSGMLLSSFVFWLLRDRLGLSARTIFLLSGLLTVPVAVYAFAMLPQATIRFLVWLGTHTIYRVRIEGRENLPAEGGALLVANHISWADGVLLLTMTSRPIRMIAYAPYAEKWFLRGLSRVMGVIPLKPTPKSIQAAFATAREAIVRGELVCIFPEGAISRSGMLQEFKPGVMAITKNTTTPVIPIYLDQLWGSIFSFKGGKFLWKWPQHVPYPVSIHIGRPLATPENVLEVRQAVQHLGVEAVQNRQTHTMVLPRIFLRKCRSALWRSKVADSTGVDLTGGKLLTRTLVFRRLLLRRVLAPDERFVGLLLPPAVAGVLANAAITLSGRIPVNLNYTVTSETLNYCIRQCGIRHVLTSRKFMEKVNLTLDCEIVYLEDLKTQVTKTDKFVSALQAYTVPSAILERQLGLHKIKSDDLFTVIFTSGSTGQPKGVMLTYANIGSNAQAIEQVIHITKRDVICGILPLFHSMGFTITLWAVLGLDLKGVYHYSPLDARQIGKLCQEHRVTILLSTPTFLRNYIRRCEKEELASLEVVVAGAEKLPADVSTAFEEKFGVRPVEGYGTTELSPLVSVNIPPSRALAGASDGLREGTVGRCVPGVMAKIIHSESGEDLPVGEAGLLLIKGPNVMQGYLGQPEITAKVIRDGWYTTGDIAFLDADDFIHITGRQSRFSKIGGEMVPHLKIEELLERIISPDEQALCVAVTAVPDERKGERLVVLHTTLPKPVGEIVKELSAGGLPNLWIPSPDSFFLVDEIPVLGTGKLDLQALKRVALDKAGAPAAT